jgi:hypothetical protein
MANKVYLKTSPSGVYNPSEVELGEVVIDLTNSRLQTKNLAGSVVNIAGEGATGPTGPQGPAGSPGGATGATGPVGVSWRNGSCWCNWCRYYRRHWSRRSDRSGGWSDRPYWSSKVRLEPLVFKALPVLSV